jgi:hypothetical protein
MRSMDGRGGVSAQAPLAIAPAAPTPLPPLRVDLSRKGRGLIEGGITPT